MSLGSGDTINDTSLANCARDEIIRQLDAEIANKYQTYNAK